MKVVVIGKAFLNENHQCCSKTERPWYTVLIWNMVPCPSKDGWGSAAIRYGPHVSETQHSRSLILAHTTSPEEVGREVCSFQSLRDPGWWRIHLISIWAHYHIFRGKHWITTPWLLNLSIDVTLPFTFSRPKQVAYACLASRGWRNVVLEGEERNVWEKIQVYHTYLKTDKSANKQKKIT